MAEETMKSKTYVNGFCKAIPTQFGEIINFEINPKDLEVLPKNEKGFVKLQMMKRREVGKYGETHYMILNTYEKKQEPQSEHDNAADDLPF